MCGGIREDVRGESGGEVRRDPRGEVGNWSEVGRWVPGPRVGEDIWCRGGSQYLVRGVCEVGTRSV